MAEILRIVSNINTPLALLAVVLVLSFFGYARYLKSQEKKLELLPAVERSKAVDSDLTRYNIDAGNLTREQKFQLILDARAKRYRFSLFVCAAAAIVFVICILVAVFGPSSPPVPAPPKDTSLSLRMETTGMMTATEDKLGSHFAFTLSNSIAGLAIVESLELEVLDVIEDRWPIAEAQFATFKYQLTLNPKQRGGVRFAGEFKYSPGEVDRFALNVYSAPEGYDYFVRIVVKWYDDVSKMQRKTASDVMVARFPKGDPWGRANALLN